jgi:predicted DNA-binding mobile mystery protein A
MDKMKQKLIIEQIDNKLKKYNILKNIQLPKKGWIYSIRKALHMSLEQLGIRIESTISAQAVRDVERREIEKSITLSKLYEVADALDLKFVYGFIPLEGSLEKFIKHTAKVKAREVVLRTSKQMALENQKVSDRRLKKAIDDKAEEIESNLPRYLWD